MKASMYFKYPFRSLLRGGQRTVLAVFCVAVGVLAIVALQLVGVMVNNALTANVRNANGGDINVSAGVGTRPFTQDDLSYFDQLKRNGTITNYTALSGLQGSFSATIRVTDIVRILVVDPQTFPVVSPPVFNQPAGGSISSLLTGNGAIIDQKLADTYHKKIGDTLTLHVSQDGQRASVLTVRVAGIVTDSGALAAESNVLLISQAYYQQLTPKTPQTFSTIEVTTVGDAQTKTAQQQITNRYPLAVVQTAAQALQATQSQSDTINKFLEIAGLLALLIGGVGIVNTMQVLLSRRKIEIAMLKTTGYRRGTLSLLFGLEAAMLGLAGGILGSAAGIGISYIVRNVVAQAFSLDIPFQLDWTIVAGGVLIGLCTALIFGLLPIVQSANIRPLNVIRELPEGRGAGSIALIIVLLLILSVLFCGMAIVILNDVGLGIGAVYGTFAFLLLLSGFFTLVAWLISLLPVPERFSLKFVILVVAGVVVSALLALVLPAFGFLLLGLSLLGFVIVLLPRTWKANTRMALRNLGRQRARTTTTLLALFVGIFTIGLVLSLGQNVRDLINNSISNLLPYNILTFATGQEAATLQTNVNSIPGLQKYQQSYSASIVPVAVNDQPLAQLLRGVPEYPATGTLGRYGVLGIMSSMSGYDVANGQIPAKILDVKIVAGRDLNASDTLTNNVVIPWPLANLQPLKGKLGVGSTIIVTDKDGRSPVTLTVVGIYQATGLGAVSAGGQGIYGSKEAVAALSPGGIPQSNFSFKVEQNQVNPALTKIAQLAPNSTSLPLADLGDYINQFLNNIILVLVVVASLSLLAGIIIIANAVALAMLERRRELGILKSVGYTSGTVLGEVLIENGIIGGLGALLAMLLVTFVVSLLGTLAFKSAFSVNGLMVVGLIAGSALLAIVTALIVAWGSVRVRPLAVLRYE